MDRKALEKTASKLPEVLTTSAQHLTKIARQNVSLLKRANELEHELRAYKLARRMDQRNLSPELDFEEKVAHILSIEPTKLAALEQGVELAASGFRLGEVRTDTKNAGADGSSVDPLSAFIMSNEAFSS